jgi:hypothetical protein
MACTPPEVLVGYGTILQYENPLTSDWVTVGGTTNLSIPNRTRGELETTDGNTGGWRVYAPGILKTLEPVTYEMRFMKSQWTVLNNMMNDNQLYGWRLVLVTDPEQFYYQFCGFLTDLGDEFPMEELVMSTITIRPSGAPTYGNLA